MSSLEGQEGIITGGRYIKPPSTLVPKAVNPGLRPWPDPPSAPAHLGT